MAMIHSEHTNYRLNVLHIPGGPTGFYTEPPLNGSRPGIFNVNVYGLNKRYVY